MANENDMKTSTAAGPSGTESPVKSPVEVPVLSEAVMQRARDFIYDAVDVPELDGEITSEAGARVVALAMVAEQNRCMSAVRTAGYLEPDDRAALLKRMATS